jgi:hypothetical protein
LHVTPGGVLAATSAPACSHVEQVVGVGPRVTFALSL